MALSFAADGRCDSSTGTTTSSENENENENENESQREPHVPLHATQLPERVHEIRVRYRRRVIRHGHGHFEELGTLNPHGIGHRRVRAFVPVRGLGHPTDPRPLLVMFDGQNVFGDRGSFAGGWHVHEAVDHFAQTRRASAPIVVAIDHGGTSAHRSSSHAPLRSARQAPRGHVATKISQGFALPARALSTAVRIVPRACGFGWLSYADGRTDEPKTDHLGR